MRQGMEQGMKARMHIVQWNTANCIYLAWKEGQRQSVSAPLMNARGSSSTMRRVSCVLRPGCLRVWSLLMGKSKSLWPNFLIPPSEHESSRSRFTLSL